MITPAELRLAVALENATRRYGPPIEISTARLADRFEGPAPKRADEIGRSVPRRRRLEIVVRELLGIPIVLEYHGHSKARRREPGWFAVRVCS